MVTKTKIRRRTTGGVSLSTRLVKLRLAAGLSQSGLASKAGVLLGRVAHIEQGVTCDPKLSTICKLADALDVAVDALRI